MVGRMGVRGGGLMMTKSSDEDVILLLKGIFNNNLNTIHKFIKNCVIVKDI